MKGNQKGGTFMKRRKLFALLMTSYGSVQYEYGSECLCRRRHNREAAESEEPAEEKPTAVTTVGPDDGTKYTFCL